MTPYRISNLVVPPFKRRMFRIEWTDNMGYARTLFICLAIVCFGWWFAQRAHEVAAIYAALTYYQ